MLAIIGNVSADTVGFDLYEADSANPAVVYKTIEPPDIMITVKAIGMTRQPSWPFDKSRADVEPNQARA